MIEIEDPSRRDALYGPADRNLRLIRAAFDVHITARNGLLRISGDDAAAGQAAQCVEELQRNLQTQPVLSDDDIREGIRLARMSREERERSDSVSVHLDSIHIEPKSEAQAAYMQSILDRDLTFCVGPAGTGKTYLAVAMAVSLLRRSKIKRLVLVRPAVEAGEKLGYLPGDIQAKVNPYLRPLFDAMNDMLSFDQVRRFIQNDVIEVVPLAFMRGRTLNNAAILLDEAQNATIQQMLMFLTRMGQGSKMVVTGDDSQSDLPNGERSGLVDAIGRLESVDGVGVVRLTRVDIVRHSLVQRVVQAYGPHAADGL